VITESQMYWITRLDDICTFLILVLGALCVAAAISFVVGMNARSDAYSTTSEQYQSGSRCVRLSAWMAVAAGIVGAALVFVPTTREYAVIKIVPAIANNETLNADGQELYGLAVEWAKQKLQSPAPADAQKQEGDK
jgi:hypothetical protein